MTEHAKLQKTEFHTSEGFKITIWRMPENHKDTGVFTAYDTAHDDAHDDGYDATLNNGFVNLLELTDRVVWILKNEMNREELWKN